MSDSVNPFIDNKGKLRHIIKKMLQSYKLDDPPTRREQLITPSILKIIMKRAKADRDIFITYLLIRAYFFTMRSCEYVATPGKPRTCIMTSDCILFF